MSQSQKLIQLPLVGTILLGLLVSIYLFARKRSAKPASTPIIVKHPVNKSADDALKYWSADKMRNARPANMPHLDNHASEKRPPNASDPKNS